MKGCAPIPDISRCCTGSGFLAESVHPLNAFAAHSEGRGCTVNSEGLSCHRDPLRGTPLIR